MSDLTVGYLPVGHDPSIAIVDDSGVRAIAEEERYSRVKRGRFVTNPAWLFQVLDEFHVDPAQVTCLAVPNIVALQERRRPDALEALPRFGQARLVSRLVDHAASQLPRLESVEHHRHHTCHAASSYLASPFESAAVITVDGMGETETASISVGEDGHLRRIESTELPHSIGYLYESLAWWSGLTGGEREGKFMGLASWGAPTQVELIRGRFLQASDDGLIRISEHLAALPMTGASWRRYVTDHLGPQRGGDPDRPDPLAADIAASIQVIIEDALLRYCERAQLLTGMTNLCLAGGVFMNTVANGSIQRAGVFESVFVQPLASDNGLSLGAALLSHRRRGRDIPRWVMSTAALGSAASTTSRPASPGHDLANTIADRILSGQVVGWVRGRAEVGARALGQRSVLADARDPRTPDRINEKLKRREKWRPFAPMVLERDAAAWGLAPSPFMTFVHPVPDEVAQQFPAVFHVDGTARLQTVGADADPLLLALLERVREITGTGVLLNTSLNGPGMPIVRTQEHALDLFRDSGLDCMVVGDAIVERDQLAPPIEGRDCGFQIDTLVVTSPTPPRTCLEDHSRTVHRLRLLPAIDGRLEPATELHFAPGESVAVAVPTWLELLVESMPRLIEWLQTLQDRISAPLVVVDPDCRTATLSELLDTRRPGLGGYASEVETFWLATVSRWHT